MLATIPFGLLRTAYRGWFQWSPTFQLDQPVGVSGIRAVRWQTNLHGPSLSASGAIGNGRYPYSYCSPENLYTLEKQTRNAC